VCSIEANILRNSGKFSWGDGHKNKSGSPPAVRADVNMFEGHMEDSAFKPN
jgi:hypothetical protein